MSDRIVSFSELASEGLIEVGAGRPRSVLDLYPSLPILRVADVLDGRIESPSQDRVSDSYRKVIGSKISRPGDVVLTVKGTVGRVALMPPDGPDFAYSPQLCYFRPAASGPLRSKYLYYWFKSTQFWNQADALKGQTDMADYLSLSDIQALKIRILPPDQQDGIIGILGALDDKIAVNDRIARVAFDLADARYIEAVGNAVHSESLGDLINLKYGKALLSGNRVKGEFPVYGSGGVTGTHNRPLVEGPGVIVGRKGTVGAVYWSEQSFFPIDTTFYVQPREDIVPMEFAFYMLKHLGLDGMNSDSAVPGLNRSNALALQVRVPDQAILKRFHQETRPLFALRESLSGESASLANVRDTLLPKLMSGEIRARDAEKFVEDVT
jgi:type I restriction enzyme S subunit